MRIWNRSAETRHLRYTQMISDGDCKPFATFNEHKPYGNVEVVKHECAGHMQKRVMPKVKLARTSFKSDKANTKKKEKALKDRMKKCLLGATQNCNESFNSLVWLRAPKTEFCSLATMKGAVGQAVIVFNSGKQPLVKLMDQLRIPAGPLCSSYLGCADQDHVKRARSKMEVEEEKADGSTQGDSCGAAAHRGRRHHLPCWRLRRHPPPP